METNGIKGMFDTLESSEAWTAEQNHSLEYQSHVRPFLWAILTEDAHNSTPFIPIQTQFQTPFRSQQTLLSLHRLAQDEKVCLALDLDSLIRFRPLSRTAWRRVKEFVRLFLFGHRLRTRANRLYIRSNSVFVQGAGEYIFKGSKIPNVDPETPLGSWLQVRQTSPLQSLQNHGRDPLAQHLWMLAQAPSLQDTYFMRQRLWRKHKETNRFTTPTLTKAALIANRVNPVSGETRYLSYLKTVLLLPDRLAAQNREAQRKCQIWYNKRAYGDVPAHWVPKPVCRAAEHSKPDLWYLKQFFDHQCHFDELPLSLRTMLAKRRHSSGPTALAVLCHILLRPDLASKKSLLSDPDIDLWFREKIQPCLPMVQTGQTCPDHSHVSKQAELIGWPDGETGLGRNCRMLASMLNRVGVSTDIISSKDLSTVSKIRPVSGRSLKHAFAVHCVNADRIPMHIMSPQFVRRPDLFHIGFCLWEQTKIPHSHTLALDMLDCVWTPSKFVQSVYEGCGTADVRYIGKAIPELPLLARLGADSTQNPSCFELLMVFDVHSSVERKNPLAAVRGFQSAFPARRYPDCRLHIKVTPTVAQHWGDPLDQLGTIRSIARHDPRIKLTEAWWTSDQLFQAIAAAHAVISPHRAEGFGYIPAFALGAARPVITTDFGGVQDFCSQASATCVPAPLVEVPKGHAIFDAPGAEWADVSPDALASALGSVYSDYNQAMSKARKGQDLVQQAYSPKSFETRVLADLRAFGLI